MSEDTNVEELESTVAEDQKDENQNRGESDSVSPEEEQQEANKEGEDDDPQERNWREFRERRKVEREKAKEVERLAAQKAEEAEALRKALEAALDKPKRHENDPYAVLYDESENNEQDIEKKLEAMLDQREKKRKEEDRQRELQELPHKLKRDYGDFDQVCSQENIDYFEYHYPEIASTYQYMPEGYEKYSSLYKAMKKLIPEARNQKARKQAEANLSKPRSPSAPGAEQTSDGAPMYLDEARRQANWRRMQQVMRGIS